MATNSTSEKSAKQTITIPDEQWEIPASFSADGSKMASLRDVVDKNVSTMSLSQLTTDQRAELVAKRIELQPKFELAMVGAGIVGKERAIAEVKAQSDVGRVLIEIEQRLINNLIEQTTQEEE